MINTQEQTRRTTEIEPGQFRICTPKGIITWKKPLTGKLLLPFQGGDQVDLYERYEKIMGSEDAFEYAVFQLRQGPMNFAEQLRSSYLLVKVNCRRDYTERMAHKMWKVAKGGYFSHPQQKRLIEVLDNVATVEEKLDIGACGSFSKEQAEEFGRIVRNHIVGHWIKFMGEKV